MVVVIDYRAGNLYNVGNALRHLGADFVFSGEPSTVRGASRVILPGVGSARAAMDSLAEQGLVEVIRKLQVPFLGICLGLQVLFEASEEDKTPCLGILPGIVCRFPSSRELKVPHIGWNEVRSECGELLSGLGDSGSFYFVHSYYAPLGDFTKGTTDYGPVSFSSVVAKDNFRGVQFHPERSGEIGLRVLRNFLQLRD